MGAWERQYVAFPSGRLCCTNRRATDIRNSLALPAVARLGLAYVKGTPLTASPNGLGADTKMTTTIIRGQSQTMAANIATDAYLPPRPILRIHLLGSMRATSYLGDDVLPRSKKARAALAYLCLAHQGRAPRSRIASMLWDRVSDPQARVNFRQAVFDLNEAMGSLAAELIVTGRATVRLNTDICWIDALALIKSPYSDDDSARADLAILCPGELLEGFDGLSASFGAWLAKERLRFREKIAGSLDAVLQQTVGGGDTKQIATLTRRLVSLDPTHREASRALIHALMKLGAYPEALREYERCREALSEAFRVKPDLAIEQVYESIQAQVSRTGSSAADVSIPKTLPSRHRLRVGISTFDAARKEESLALSLSHEVAAGLARFRWFDVIPPASLSRNEYAGLDYVVEGAISGRGKKLQITVQLLELVGRAQAQPVWSERFNIALSQLHRLDELVTVRIVARIDPVILHIEGQPKRRERYGATGLLLQAIPMIFSMERKQYEEAGQLIHRALSLEPNNAAAEAWAAHWHLFYLGQGWADDVERRARKRSSMH
jgi:DNA-binding SARP family transcriptional activator